ncbi:hypothetical protein C5Y96_05830 [Blastopirellula marina]|uniref:Uncharacterized protein n=1 Tax=Blastopirellula marina TaxID=124 RepID=A0A2S8G4M5_9BACT|nr:MULTISPECIES: hypothetical protein [Pirellulaceae]PQO39373.1 hypothetical protein C5Y96_05830 [Blastopirellula marina]RCS55681.1 hypothetical protein DTL36_05840 [Bremerella cremea]
MASVVELNRPIRRRVGNLIIEIHEKGITLRGSGRRKRRTFTWEQIAALDQAGTVQAASDEALGRRVLKSLHALPKGGIPHANRRVKS